MIVYEIDGKAYINMTNRCSNACTFCVRSTSDRYSEYALWLKEEPTYDEIIAACAGYLDEVNEFVFCGYGEPLFRLDMLERVGEYLKSKNKHVRLNTNGQADLIVGAGVAARLKGKIDTVNVSLNEVSAEEYQKICRCAYGEDGYRSMLTFAADCVKQGIKVTMSVVDIIGEEKIKKAQKIAESVGAELRVRALIK